MLTRPTSSLTKKPLFDGLETLGDSVFALLVGLAAAGLIFFVAMAMYEKTLARIDQQNQEQMHWICTSADVSSCVPINTD